MLLIFSDTYRNFVKKGDLKFHRKITFLGTLFDNIPALKACNFIKKRVQQSFAFSCEICEIFKSTYLEEHLQTTASVLTLTHKKGIKKVLSHKLLKILSLNPSYYRSEISYMQQTK